MEWRHSLMSIEKGKIYTVKESIKALFNDSESRVLVMDKKEEGYFQILPVSLKSSSDYIELNENDFISDVIPEKNVQVHQIMSISEKNIEKEVAKISESKLDEILRASVKSVAHSYYKTKEKKSPYIAVSGKKLDEKELFNMIDASLDMWLTTGRFNDEFEKKLAGFIGVQYALSVNSGSSANLLALSALTSPRLGDRQLKEGDEVISVAAGFPTTITPIIQNGLVPVFVDVEIGTYEIDVEQIDEAISGKTKAIMIAHTLGNTFNVAKIKDICKKNNLWLIEDNCDALGSKYNGKYTGQFGDIATLSFYPAHHITMGEGGAVLTDNDELYHILMSFRDWGRDCWCPPGHDNTCSKRFNQKHGNLPFGYDHKYVYSHLGYNLKISDWQAAIGVAQLEKLPEFIAKRIENFKVLTEGLRDLEEHLILPQATEGSEPSWFGLPLSVKDSQDKVKLLRFLESNNIGTRNLFAGNMLRQPAFVEKEVKFRIRDSKLLLSNQLKEEDYSMLPNTDFVMNNTFWIGTWPGIGEIEAEKIIKAFHHFFEAK